MPCARFHIMKSFEELGRETWERLIIKDAEVGTETSSAGKIRRKSGGRQRSWVDVMAGRDYLGLY